MSDLERRALLGVAGLGAIAAMSKAGPLTPPVGAVASTGKTLDQVEPRRILDDGTNVGQVNLSSGSYKCTRDIQVSTATYRMSSRTSIDLCGFKIIGNSAVVAISAIPGTNDFRIHNGFVGSNIFPVAPTPPNNVVLENLTFVGAGTITLGNSCVVRNCTFIATSLDVGIGCLIESCIFKSDTVTNAGLTAGESAIVRDVSISNTLLGGGGSLGLTVGILSTIERCTSKNFNGTAIATGERCCLTDCTASGAVTTFSIGIGSSVRGCNATGLNTTTCFDLGNQCIVENCTARGGGEGFFVRDDTILRNCLAQLNALRGFAITGAGCSIEACAARTNTGRGFDLANSNRIERCIAVTNTGGGYALTSDTLARGNHGDSNTLFGMLVSGGDNRIESNSMTDGTVGFQIDGAGNLVINNSSAGSATPFTIAAGNAAGPIVGSAGVATNTVSTANFAF